MISKNEQDFLLTALRDGKIRLDSRSAFEFRNVNLSISPHTFGQVELQLGKTRIACTVSASIVSPHPNRATEGFLRINIHTPPTALQQVSTPPLLITRTLEQTLQKSRCIDTEGLCLVAGSKVWQIRLDLHILEDDGNLIDAAAIAAVVALATFKRPEVAVLGGEEIRVYSQDEKPFVGIGIKFWPICISFGFLDDGNLLVIDPTHTETSLLSSTLTLSMTPHHELTLLTAVGSPVDPDSIMRCISIAESKVDRIVELIREEIEKEEQRRNQVDEERRKTIAGGGGGLSTRKKQADVPSV